MSGLLWYKEVYGVKWLNQGKEMTKVKLIYNTGIKTVKANEETVSREKNPYLQITQIKPC